MLVDNRIILRATTLTCATGTSRFSFYIMTMNERTLKEGKYQLQTTMKSFNLIKSQMSVDQSISIAISDYSLQEN